VKGGKAINQHAQPFPKVQRRTKTRRSDVTTPEVDGFRQTIMFKVFPNTSSPSLVMTPERLIGSSKGTDTSAQYHD
jgi:hypothetical protein